MKKGLVNILKREEQDGVLVTTIIHVILLLLFIFPILSMTIDLPDEITGITVVFNQPLEEQEFTPVVKQQVENQKVNSTPSVTKKEKVEKEIPEKDPPRAVKETIITQDIESPAPALIETKTTEKSAEVIAAEAKAKLEAENIAKAEKLAASKSQFGSLFGNSNGSTQEESSDIGGQDTDVLDAISSGQGTIGQGLTSRGISYRPNITDLSDREGTVIVKVCIDVDGKVISADYVQSGSTTSDQRLINTAIKGAKQYRFEPNSNVEKQCGEITIEFEVS